MNKMPDLLLKTVLYLDNRKQILHNSLLRHHFNKRFFNNKFHLKKIKLLKTLHRHNNINNNSKAQLKLININ